MTRTNAKKRTSTIVRKIFEMLLDHPEGLSVDEIWQRLEHSQPQNGNNKGGVDDLKLSSFLEMSFSCVAPIRAGWLLIDRYQWSLSPEGRFAYERYKDPETFMKKAARRSARGWLSLNFPRSYAIAGRAKDQITSEYKAARRIGLRRLLRERFGEAAPWQEILPIQLPRRIEVRDPQLSNCDSIVNYLDSLGAPYSEGGHAVYLPPDSAKRTAFAGLASSYPAGVGIKVVKEQGGIDDSNYVNVVTKGDSHLQLGLIHHHRHLTLVANLLHSQHLGPRLYDLVELQCGNRVWTAYVIEHVSGAPPSIPECEAGIARLRELDSAGLLKVIPPEGFADEEFECPTCSNNALTDQHGEFRYIDFQNFFLADYESFLTSVAVEATEKSHFGDMSILRGGRYLYQSVPGVRLPGKRSVAERIAVLSRMMGSCRVSIKDHLVLDVGCNIGMMMAQYLKLGAGWCHGWDRAYLTPHTDNLLLALGCTRFSTSGADISKAQPLEEDLPAFLRPRLQNCVISYLAVRGHLGWLDALGRIPWSFLLYEGHEGETSEDMDKHLKELANLTAFEVGAVDSYIDGDSDRRTVAVLTRKTP